MKNLIILLSVFVFLSSCTSVRKLVEEGKYDEAIIYSIKKLKGKKNKKTKYVKAIEKAFAKVTKKDMSRISFLQEEKKGNYWGEIYDIAYKIKKRQSKIEPLLPLISKDGYQAKFKFVRTKPIILKAKDNASAYLYNRGASLLSRARARNSNKKAARMAFSNFSKIKKYNTVYKNSEELMNEAYSLGQEKVLIKVKNLSNVILPKGFYRELKEVNTSGLDEMWLKFYTEDDAQSNFDYKISMNIRNIDISPERETIREFVEEKEIKDGFTYLYDEKGNVKKDSLGNDIKEDRFAIVKAKVFELYRTKAAIVKGDIKIKDLNNKRTYKSVPVNVESVFESFASRYEGNKKALSEDTKKRLRKYPEPFPTNKELLMMAVDDLKRVLLNEIEKNMK